MPDNAGLNQMMRQHRHCEPGGAADLNRVCIGRANAEMLGEDRRKHDMRRDGRITAEDAVDVCSRQAGIGDRKLGGLAHEVEGGRALMPAECRQSDAGDEAHGFNAALVTPSRTNAAISSEEKPASRKISVPCSLSRGASRVGSAEVSDQAVDTFMLRIAPSVG